MRAPTIALCVPAYNAAAHLPRLLHSARAQAAPFDEILVYDDASNDDTGTVARQWGARVIRGERNRGCSFGKNTLAEVAQCDWIHFHDADDALCPSFISHARRWMERPDAPDVVLFAYETRDEETERVEGIRRFDDQALRHDPIAYTILEQINPFCGLYRRERFIAAGGYDLDPRVLYNEDVAMHCRLARRGLRFAADPNICIINYRSGSSMSQANRVACIRAHYHVLRKAAQELGERYAGEISLKLWRAAGVAAAHLDWPTADAAVDLAVRLRGRIPSEGHFAFRTLCAIHPRLALRIREAQVRIRKPRFRRARA